MRSIILVVALLLITSPARAGTFTTTPEQDAMLADMAADQKGTPEAALATILNQLVTHRAHMKASQDASSIASACTKGDTAACDALSRAARELPPIPNPIHPRRP